MGSDQDDWLRRNTLTATEIAIRKDRERQAFARSWVRSSAKILAREHAIYGGPFRSKPITVASIAAAGASIDAAPAMPQREAMGAAASASIDDKLWAVLGDRDRWLRAGYSAQLTEFLDKHLGIKPGQPAPAAPSDLPTDPELRALVLQIRELAKD